MSDAVQSNDFLALPAFELEAIPAGAAQVGDQIRLKPLVFKVEGVAAPAQELKVEVPSGGTPLSEQGWTLLPADPGAAQATDFYFTVVPMQAGNLTLPSLALVNSVGKPVARTNPFFLKVESTWSTSEKREPLPLRPPVRLAFPTWVFVVGTVALLTLLFASVYGFLKWYKKRKARVALRPQGPPLPEDQVALMQLAELEKQGLTRKGEFKAYYFGISEVLKNYIGVRFRFDAPESTSVELMGYLEERRAVSDTVLDQLEGLFARLDLVKFTDHIPSGPEPLLLIEETREWIRITRRPVEVAIASMEETKK